ncbi:MAG: N-acetyltransferase [Dehalococcoidia bacterium]|nr:N-acetyltransferase [Dehalococcoidia bacterium]MDZ4247119.1 N-acetyltransferase [Dehalococcoidia bacterium]
MPARVKYKVEKANISDIPEMHSAINHFAQKGEMLPRSLSELYENIRDYFVVREEDKVIGCGALHISWSDLAEIKALAVYENKQKNNIGTAIIKASLKEAKKLGIPTVFCLTYRPEFFEKSGFHRVELEQLPRKVWGECQRCAKFPHCDEIALLINI